MIFPRHGLALHLRRTPVLLLCAALASPAAFGAQTAAASAAPHSASARTAAKPAATAANAASASSSRAAAPTDAELQQAIAKLPPLTGTGIDAAQRSRDILAHLNSVLRFYRAALQPIQKVGEPSDVLYSEQSVTEATSIAQLAFRAARSEATLLGKVASGNAPAGSAPSAPHGQPTEAQRLAALRAQIAAQTAALQARSDALDAQMARARDLPTLRQEKEQVQGGLELQHAMAEALSHVSAIDTAAQSGLLGDIDRLQRSAPELLAANSKPIAPPVLRSLTSDRDAGVASQAVDLFQLLSTRRDIENQIATLDLLHKQGSDLRAPIVKILRQTVQRGQALSQSTVDLGATPTTDAEDLANTRKQFDTLTATFEVLASSTLPLTQEIALEEQARGTLTSWDTVVTAEYKSILRSLLLRVSVIAIALAVLFLLGKLWGRATVRYVHDLRRRRQLLLLRRMVVGFLSGLILIFGFVTQFSSLATFAGFISAGIAVGLQTILLSVAAYFFIVGRYGVRVGDRITVANVTGDVIEVGLVRFYMMELAGTGTELHSTGRVAVFANSVLFQTGTPIYKQIPGTEYAWHELIARINPGADPNPVSTAILAVVDKVFATYSDRITAQHHDVEAWMGTALDPPRIDSRLQLTDTGLQLAVLFPVEISHAADVDQQIAEALLAAINADETLRSALAAVPSIKAAIKS